MSEPVNWVPLLRVESLTCDKNSTLFIHPQHPPLPILVTSIKSTRGKTHTHTYTHSVR